MYFMGTDPFHLKTAKAPQILINIHQTQEVTDAKLGYFQLDVIMVS